MIVDQAVKEKIFKCFDEGMSTYAIAAFHEQRHYDVMELLRRSGRAVSSKHIDAITEVSADGIKLALEIAGLIDLKYSSDRIAKILRIPEDAVNRVAEDWQLASARKLRRAGLPIQDLRIREDDLMIHVCKQLDVSLDKVLGKDRGKELSRARDIIAFLADKHCNSTQSEIALLLGRGVNNSAGGYYLKRATLNYESNRTFARITDEIEATLV